MSQANDGKALETSVDGKSYARIPLRTRVVMPEDDLDAIITEYAKDAVQPGRPAVRDREDRGDHPGAVIPSR